jgi:hypothetical protein
VVGSTMEKVNWGRDERVRLLGRELRQTDNHCRPCEVLSIETKTGSAFTKRLHSIGDVSQRNGEGNSKPRCAFWEGRPCFDPHRHRRCWISSGASWASAT